MISLSKQKKIAYFLGGGVILLLGLFLGWNRSETDGRITDHAEQGEKVQVTQAHPQYEAPAIEGRQRSAHPGVVRSWSPETRQQLALLDQILVSKNDNDPRLDQELARLSEEAQEALREKYGTLRMEDRNARGTVVFLLSRYSQSERNQEFFLSVLKEAPCLSLENCEKASDTDSPEALHSAQAGMDVTLGYPQLVVLQAVEEALSQRSLTSIEAEMLQVALQSPITSVQRKAEKIRERL